MTEAGSRLNEEEIFVGSIYDALLFDPAFSQIVTEVMNKVALDLLVGTTADLVKKNSEIEEIYIEFVEYRSVIV
jgi:hypothetical protein